MTEINSVKTLSKRGIIVLGSARSDGNTKLMVERLVEVTGMEVLDLNDFDIGYFEYNNYDRGDDFLNVVRKLLQYELIVFATPVYWYNMSAIMKNFFDRITDLIKHHKDLGRKLRNKSMAVLSCSASPGPDTEFSMPFKKTAEYLGMHFLAHVATWSFDNSISDEVGLLIDDFATLIDRDD